MELSGVSLPVIEAHCEYRAPGAVRRRDRDQDDGPAAVAGAHGVQLRGSSDRPTRRSRRRAGQRMRRSIEADGRAGCPSASGRPSHEGTGHRRRRLHRIAPDGSAARSRRGRRRHRLLHRLLSAGDQGSQPGRQLRAGRDSASSKPRCSRRIWRRCSTAGRTSFTSRPRPASARAGAATSASTPTTTSMRRSVCSRPASAGRSAVRLRLELVGLRRQRQPFRCAKTRCRSRSRRMA